jgi:hypothetical protein
MKMKALILVPVLGLALAGCGAISFEGTCSNGHCTGTAGPAGPNNSVSPSASIPGEVSCTPIPDSRYCEPPSPTPTVTVTQYVDIVQQCFPDPSENQLTSLAANVPSCLGLSVQQQDIFVTVIQEQLDQTPRSMFHTQQGRDDWRDHVVAAAVQQAHQQG